MNNLSVADALRVVAPDEVGPEFNAFISPAATSGGIPTPTRTPDTDADGETVAADAHADAHARRVRPDPARGRTRRWSRRADGDQLLRLRREIHHQRLRQQRLSHLDVQRSHERDLCRLGAGDRDLERTDSCYVNHDGSVGGHLRRELRELGHELEVERRDGRQPTGVPASRSPREFPLSPGTHTIKFRTRNPNVKYDRSS
jgi:hypothetical protein